MIVSSFNPKTAYASRRRDWSSDVCSSDLPGLAHALLHPPRIQRIHRRHPLPELVIGQRPLLVQPLETRTMLLRRVTFRHEVVLAAALPGALQIGRASRRDRGGQEVSTSRVAVRLTRITNKQRTIMN